MAEPSEFLIVQNLQAALQAISTLTGSHYSVASTAVKLDPNANIEAMLRPSEFGEPPRVWPMVLIELKPDAWEYDPANRVKLTLPMTIHWVSESVPTDDKSLLQTFLRGCADVERAIAADITRGGAAYDTRITGRTLDLSLAGSRVWAQIETEIRLRRDFGTP